MKRVSFVLFCSLLGIALAQVTVPPEVPGQTPIATEKLVGALRILNTAEYSYRSEHSRFASREEILLFLRMKGMLGQAPIDLKSPEPHTLEVTTSPDGMHYQITLQRPADMNDKSTWCKTAAFSDERAVIFLGLAIDCEGAPR